MCLQKTSHKQMLELHNNNFPCLKMHFILRNWLHFKKGGKKDNFFLNRIFTDRISFPLVSRFMKRVLSHRCYTNTRIMKSDRFLVYTEINLLFQFMKLETSSTSK